MSLLVLCSCSNKVEQESCISDNIVNDGIAGITGVTGPDNTESSSIPQKKLVLLIDFQKVPVKWENCKAVDEILEYVTEKECYAQMGMYARKMQMGSLGKRFTAVKGDIVMYSGNSIVLFYGTDTGKYTKLGHIDLSEYEISVLLEKHAVNIILKAE